MVMVMLVFYLFIQTASKVNLNSTYPTHLPYSTLPYPTLPYPTPHRDPVFGGVRNGFGGVHSLKF